MRGRGLRSLNYKMCNQCKTNPVYEFTNKRTLCKTCYVRWFQKKVLYTIRKFDLINQGDVIGIKKGNDFRSVVLIEVMEFYSKKARVEVVKLPSKKKVDKVANELTLNDNSLGIVHLLFEGDLSKGNFSAKFGKEISPLYLFLDCEVMLYAKLRGLKFKLGMKKIDDVSLFVNDLEEKHPELKRAVVNGFVELGG